MAAASRAGVEWPTVAVAAAIYAGFGLLTWHYHALPWWIVVPAGAYLVAWYGSLQHEVVHGHPTRWRGVNEAIAYPSLWLWLPFRVYRASHEAHHRAEVLADPLDDPESFYVEPARWARFGPARRALLAANNTSLGRLAIGPFTCIGAFLAGEIRRFAGGDASHLRAWLHHGAGCAIVVGWVSGVCEIPLARYVALIALPGVSLTLLRSFAEHRASAEAGGRTAVVEASWPMSLLFLNNNLHVVHHREPGVAWYRLPRRWRETRDAAGAAGGERYRGYADVIARHALRPRAPVAYPL